MNSAPAAGNAARASELARIDREPARVMGAVARATHIEQIAAIFYGHGRSWLDNPAQHTAIRPPIDRPQGRSRAAKALPAAGAGAFAKVDTRRPLCYNSRPYNRY